MTSKPDALRRLIDLPGVNDLEYRALLKRDFAEPEARAEFPEIEDEDVRQALRYAALQLPDGISTLNPDALFA